MENAYVLELSESKFKDLFLCSCGFAQCEPLHGFGPAVRPNFLIHYIMEGRGYYQTGGRSYCLGAGEGFLIEPEVLTYYQSDKEEPWSYLWIGFAGRHAKEYLADLGLNSRQLTFCSSQGKEFKHLILEMLKCQKDSVTGQYRLQSLLYGFFELLSRDLVFREDELSLENFYIERAVSYIRNHYSEELKVADIAKYLCVDRSYLYKLFKHNLQMSPKEFLTSFRISRSRELLCVTQLSIENVALSCGYQNAIVFSKAFKQNVGCAPTVYRKKHEKEMKQNLQENQGMLEVLKSKSVYQTVHQKQNKMLP